MRMTPVRYQIVKVSKGEFYIRFKRGLSFWWNSRFDRVAGQLKYFASITTARTALDLLVRKHSFSQRKATEVVVYEERYGALENLPVKEGEKS